MIADPRSSRQDQSSRIHVDVSSLGERLTQRSTSAVKVFESKKPRTVGTLRGDDSQRIHRRKGRADQMGRFEF
jgi:hypothetical protein